MCGDTGTLETQEEGDEPDEAREHSGHSRGADLGLEGGQEGPCARHSQLCLASLPHPPLKRTREPVASTVSSLPGLLASPVG